MPLSPWELLIILAIVIAIFGAGKLAGVGNALGTSIREFRQAVQGDNEPEQPTERHDEPTDTTRA